MYQQSFRFYDLEPEQLSLDLDVPKSETSYLASNNLGSIMWSGASVGMTNSYITNYGINIKVQNRSWLKTKVGNWLGIKYL